MANITSKETNRRCVPLIQCTEKTHHFGGGIPPKMHNFNLIMRKHETNSNQETFYKIIDQDFKTIELRKIQKD